MTTYLIGEAMTERRLLDLVAIADRYRRALDAKPSKGDITPDGIAAITDSVADVPDLLAEVERLTRWKAEALPVMDGMQELGRALGLPPGALITGPMALAEAQRLKATVTDLRAYIEGAQRGADSLRATLAARMHELATARDTAQRVAAITYQSSDGTEYEHNGHPPNHGEPECPACWAADIRQALNGRP